MGEEATLVCISHSVHLTRIKWKQDCSHFLRECYRYIPSTSRPSHGLLRMTFFST
jgi:hypothetical protein